MLIKLNLQRFASPEVGTNPETWLLNETLTDYDSMNYGTDSDWYGDSNGFNENINFICNGVQYYGINAFNTHIPPEITMSVKLVYNNSSWIDEKYRTITFANAPTGDLLTWLQANGVKHDDMPPATRVTFEFDSNVIKIEIYADANRINLNTTITTSGSSYNIIPQSTYYLKVYMTDGYIIDEVVSTYGTSTVTGNIIRNVTNDTFDFVETSNGDTITITSKQSSTYSIEAGSYEWNAEFDVELLRDTGIGTQSLIFKSNNEDFTAMKIDDENAILYYVKANGTNVLVSSVDDGFNESYRTITLDTTQNVSETFYNNAFSFMQPLSAKVSIDLTTLSGWGNVASGEHNIQVVAKADGYRDSEKSTAVTFSKGSAFTQVAVTLTNPFSSYISMNASNAPFGRISNMDKTKIYSIQLTEDYYKNDITYLTYNGTQWVANDALINIKNQTETSVDLYKGLVGGSTSELFNIIALEGTTQASVSDFTGYTGTETMPDYICLIKGTLVTLADGTTKPIEDITYDDELLVWNFYDGKFDKAKPCWVTKPQIAHEYNLCKFSNGAEIGFVGQGGDIGYHRIYNDELKSFTHTGVKETPIGTHTFAQDGSKPTLIEQHIVTKPVRFYNVGTQKHINIFTNGILTSARLSNKYAIKDMKYVGEQLISDEYEQEYIRKKLKRC